MTFSASEKKAILAYVQEVLDGKHPEPKVRRGGFEVRTPADMALACASKAALEIREFLALVPGEGSVSASGITSKRKCQR